MTILMVCSSPDTSSSWALMSEPALVVTGRPACFATSSPVQLLARSARECLYFMHASASAHFNRVVGDVLNSIYHNSWIGSEYIAWPPHPLHFYLWGQLNAFVYSAPVHNMDTLHQRSVNASQSIRYSPQNLRTGSTVHKTGQST
jgi:hypothetical protein